MESPAFNFFVIACGAYSPPEGVAKLIARLGRGLLHETDGAAAEAAGKDKGKMRKTWKMRKMRKM